MSNSERRIEQPKEFAFAKDLAEFGFVIAVGANPYPPGGSRLVKSQISTLVKSDSHWRYLHKAKKLFEWTDGEACGVVITSGPADAIAFLNGLRRVIDHLQVSTPAYSVAVHCGPFKQDSQSQEAFGKAINEAVFCLKLSAGNDVLFSETAASYFGTDTGALRLVGTFHSTAGASEKAFAWDTENIRHKPGSSWLWSRAQAIHYSAEKSGREIAPVFVIFERLVELRKAWGWALIILVVALLFHWTIENSEPGAELKSWTFQNLISQVPTAGPMPVTVVDFGSSLGVAKTNMRDLAKLVDSVAAYKPAAIAIDVNLGLESGLKPGAVVQASDYTDPSGVVLEHCLALRKQGIPVFAACESVGTSKSDEWFGDDDFTPMAVHPYLPTPGLDGQVDLIGRLKIGAGPAMPSLCETLAGYVPSSGRAPFLLAPSWLATSEEDEAPPVGATRYLAATTPSTTIQASRYYLNVSAIRRIALYRTVPAIGAQVGGLADRLIPGQVVIIGSTQIPSDQHEVAAMGGQVPGVDLLAAGVVTMAGQKVLMLRPWALWIINIFTAFLIVSSGPVIRRIFIANPRDLSEGSIGFVVIATVTVVTFFGGLLLARAFHILWFDYILALLIVLSHPRIEENLEMAWKGLLRLIRGETTHLFFKGSQS